VPGGEEETSVSGAVQRRVPTVSKIEKPDIKIYYVDEYQIINCRR
jgi:hypothetical protein